ncbi:MAG: winged helix-turn-helix domain-containing protein [Candidatus Binatia bacterium]
MRRPAQIKQWMSPEELAVWVREAPSKEAYKERLAIWLTYIGPYHARQVADMLQVSKQAVWLWVGRYNKHGPQGMQRKGRGGRRWAYLSLEEEAALLRSLEERAAQGEILTVPQILDEVRTAVGKKVSLAYLYKMLHRQGWRKLGPRPHHTRVDREKQEDFKKTSPPSSKRR